MSLACIKIYAYSFLTAMIGVFVLNAYMIMQSDLNKETIIQSIISTFLMVPALALSVLSFGLSQRLSLLNNNSTQNNEKVDKLKFVCLLIVKIQLALKPLLAILFVYYTMNMKESLTTVDFYTLIFFENQLFTIFEAAFLILTRKKGKSSKSS